MKKLSLLLALILFSGMSLTAASLNPKDVNPVGTWTYSAPDAPYGYQAGDIVVAKEKDAYTVSLKLGEYAIKGYNVKYEKNLLSFTVYIESESVMIKATFEENKISGKANTSEGDIPFTATRKKEEGKK